MARQYQMDCGIASTDLQCNSPITRRAIEDKGYSSDDDTLSLDHASLC